MANVLTSLQKLLYAKKVQAELFFKVSALSLANMVDIPKGITFNNPKIGFNTVDDYVKNVDITIDGTSTQNETLTINTTPLVAFGIDDIEELEIDYNFVDTQATKAAQVIRERLDGDFFNEILNADEASPATIALTVGASGNTVNTFAQAVATLVNNWVDESNLVSVIDPHTSATIGEAALGNTFKEADMEFRRWFRGRFVNTSTMVSSLLTCTGSLAFGTLPTATDTVTINGATFTFVAAIGTTEGNVLIEAGDAPATLDNLVAAINGGAGAGTKYIDFTSEATSDIRKRKLTGLTATDNTTSMLLTSKKGYRVVSSALTAAWDKWGQLTIHNAIMQKGSISMAIQKWINLVTRVRPLQLGMNYFTWMRYGIKTFTEGAERMYNLKIEAQAAET